MRNIKAPFERPKHLDLTSFKSCYETSYLGENVKHLPKQKVAQNVNISLGYFFWPDQNFGFFCHHSPIYKP
jgi:hypothetical protein